MLQIIPFVTWLAAITSGVLPVILWLLRELEPRSLAVLLGWFLLAVYGQFLWGSAVVAAGGLLLQTILAIYLIVRWRLSY